MRRNKVETCANDRRQTALAVRADENNSISLYLYINDKIGCNELRANMKSGRQHIVNEQ